MRRLLYRLAIVLLLAGSAIAVDATNVYWTPIGGDPEAAPPMAGSVLSVPLAGGPVTVLATKQAVPTAIALDDKDCLLLEDLGLRLCANQNRIALYDAVTGKELGDHVAVCQALEAEIADEHEAIVGGLDRAVAVGVVDEVIDPVKTRQAILDAIANAPAARGRHGNIPL